MDDPFPFSAGPLASLTTSLSESLNLHTLPLHIHEILFFFVLYTVVQSASPRLSTYFAPRHYPRLSAKTRLSWDVHVVSFVQSTLIDLVALWAMFGDQSARRGLGPKERVWGYTGVGGLIQAMAAGYFLWDLIVTASNIKVFGLGMLAHASSALTVYMLGFRPFVNFYAPTFILFELSSPFLNIHWFLDKLEMTGSRPQWWNGMILLATFFSCRLVWGTYASISVFWDIFVAIRNPGLPFVQQAEGLLATSAAQAQQLAREGDIFAPARLGNTQGGVPLWLAASYLTANMILNVLNFYWFGKMIETVLKRFKEVPAKAKKEGAEVVVTEDVVEHVNEKGAKVVSVDQVRRRKNNVTDATVTDSEEELVMV